MLISIHIVLGDVNTVIHVWVAATNGKVNMDLVLFGSTLSCTYLFDINILFSLLTIYLRVFSHVLSFYYILGIWEFR